MILKMSKLCYIYFIIIVFALPSGNPNPSIKDIVELVDGILKVGNCLGNSPEEKLSNLTELANCVFKNKLSAEIKVLQDKVDQVNSKLDDVQSELQSISSLILNLPELIQQALRLNDLGKYTTSLNTLYQDYKIYSKNITHFETETLENFANKVLYGSNSVNDVINQINALMRPPESGLSDQGILDAISNSLQKLSNAEQCSLNQSPYQVIYNIYNYIALTQMKGYVVTQFSYMLLKLHNKGNFTLEVMSMRDRYEENTKTTHELLKKNTRSLSRDLWKCDPRQHIKGKTYIEITRLGQGYILGEVDLNSIGTCSDTCETLRNPTKSYGCTGCSNRKVYRELCELQQKCHGKIYDCVSLGKKSTLRICLAEPNSGHRYTFIERGNLKVLEHSDTCDTTAGFMNSWRRGFVICDTCFCICDEPGDHSDRYFSLESVTADIKNNRVITGLRLVKKNRIIHLQIQEGKLLPKGNIDESTVRWVPVKKNCRDYHTLSWNNRSLDLDHLLTDKGHVLTGVRFMQRASRLQIAIASTPFNFLTGELITRPMDLHWKYSTSASRKLNLENPDLPILSPLPSIPNFESNRYVQFTHTDMEKDLGQNTVPYLDAQPVESLFPTPLVGAGIYHKGRNGYGGFIAPKITTYDFIQHLHIEFPTDQLQEK